MLISFRHHNFCTLNGIQTNNQRNDVMNFDVILLFFVILYVLIFCFRCFFVVLFLISIHSRCFIKRENTEERKFLHFSIEMLRTDFFQASWKHSSLMQTICWKQIQTNEYWTCHAARTFYCYKCWCCSLFVAWKTFLLLFLFLFCC